MPASFDAAARELTVARPSGRPRERHAPRGAAGRVLRLARRGRRRWRRQVTVGDVVLVCDVGGGTTDFSLIAVSRAAGRPGARARRGRRSHPARRRQHGSGARAPHAGDLCRKGASSSRGSCEAWCTHAAPPRRRCSPTVARRAPISVLGRGSQGRRRRRSRRSSRARTPSRCSSTGSSRRSRSDAKAAHGRRPCLQEIGLPYAADPAMTRHLAEFLSGTSGRATSRRAGPGLAARRTCCSTAA